MALTEDQAALLVALAAGPGFGLELIDRVKAITDGKTVLHAGTIYPALRELERQGLLRSWDGETTPDRGGRPRRYYALTEQGQASHRPLIIDDELRATCRRLRECAEDPARRYRPGQGRLPGTMTEHCAVLFGGWKVFFTITEAPGHPPFRHLTVSVPGTNLPNPMMVWTLATLLGFTGAQLNDGWVVGPGPWAMGVDEAERCLIVQQPLEAGEP